jgi:hypothetical protein
VPNFEEFGSKEGLIWGQNRSIFHGFFWIQVMGFMFGGLLDLDP